METTSFLVTGSSGFIGSRLVKTLSLSSKVVGVDIKKSPQTDILVDISLPDSIDELSKLMKGVDIIIHLAGLIQVGEGEKYPLTYHDVNVNGTIIVLEAMMSAGVKKIIFASSAAVYKPSDDPLTEKSPLGPLSVYGTTKMDAEKAISKYKGIDSVIFRFFNVGGGMETPPVHLIPIVVDRWMNSKEVHIFGHDYPTPDRTCVRDYFHVDDLIRAVEIAVDKWDSLSSPKIYNLGGGNGYSVWKICAHINIACWVTIGKRFTPKLLPRRPGDPATLIADITKAEKELEWKPKKNLEDIISDTVVEYITKNEKFKHI